MRTLHIDSGREMRGGQLQVLSLLEGLRAAGHDTILLSPAGSPLAAVARSRRLEVRDLSVRSLSRHTAGMDLIHAHDARAHTLGLTICRLPLVVARRVAFPVQSGPASRWKYGRADHFIAISKFVAGCLERASIPAERISVVYDGVDVPAETATGGRIVAPSSQDPRKRPELAAAAARSAGFDLHVSSDLAADLPGARLFVYLSDQEGLGSAALFASAHGVPVIASNIGGLREAVEHERTGLLVENDTESVAASIRLLSQDPARAAEMGARGRRRILDQFTVEAMVGGTVAVYRRVLR